MSGAGRSGGMPEGRGWSRQPPAPPCPSRRRQRTHPPHPPSLPPSLPVPLQGARRVCEAVPRRRQPAHLLPAASRHVAAGGGGSAGAGRRMGPESLWAPAYPCSPWGRWSRLCAPRGHHTSLTPSNSSDRCPATALADPPESPPPPPPPLSLQSGQWDDTTRADAELLKAAWPRLRCVLCAALCWLLPAPERPVPLLQRRLLRSALPGQPCQP